MISVYSALREEVTYTPFKEGSLFGLKTDDSYCLLATFGGRLVIRKLGKASINHIPARCNCTIICTTFSYKYLNKNCW